MQERDDDLRKEMLDLIRSLKGHVCQGGVGGRYDHLFLKGMNDREGRGTRQDSLELENTGENLSAFVRTLDDVRRELGDCQRCPLHRERRNLVFGEGNPSADLVFIGEAPGEEEDRQGRPFVGRAGQLLTKIIGAMGLERQDVYICNILKCRPPQNRNPKREEMETCEPFLIKQIEALRPKVICALGTFAARRILQTDVPITVLRGKFHEFRGVRVMPTYHPAYLLRNPDAKNQFWEDIQIIMKEL